MAGLRRIGAEATADIWGAKGNAQPRLRFGRIDIAQRDAADQVPGAIFDRPSWGGDDPLTRILIDGLAGLDRERRSGEEP